MTGMQRMTIHSGLLGTVQIYAHCGLNIHNALIYTHKCPSLEDQLCDPPNEGLR